MKRSPRELAALATEASKIGDEATASAALHDLLGDETFALIDRLRSLDWVQSVEINIEPAGAIAVLVIMKGASPLIRRVPIVTPFSK